MKTLYLLRHAHTVVAAPPLMGDHERILSPQGTEHAISIGKFMQQNSMYPDFVLSSSSVRTIQTARLIYGVLFRMEGVSIQSHFDRGLYQAPAEKIFMHIHSLDDSIQSLMVVCHNPGVADLAVTLSQNHELGAYAPGTLCVFTADCNHWSEFSPDRVTLEKIFVPD